MVVSEMIEELQKFKERYGDLEVYTISHENGFVASTQYVDLISDCDGMDTEKGCIVTY